MKIRIVFLPASSRRCIFLAFSFDLTVMGGTPKTFTIDRAMVDTVLGTNDGIVNAGPDFAAVLNHVLSGTVITATGSGIGVDLTLDQTLFPTAGHRSHFQITNVTDNVRPPPDFDLLDIDITAPGHSIDAYLDGVEAMLGKAIEAAATLGAFSKRIELQGAFTKALHGTIDKGIGRLVDADMNEASPGCVPWKPTSNYRCRHSRSQTQIRSSCFSCFRKRR